MRVSAVEAQGLSSCGSWALVVVHRGLVFAIKYGTSCNSGLYRGSVSPRWGRAADTDWEEEGSLPGGDVVSTEI